MFLGLRGMLFSWLRRLIRYSSTWELLCHVPGFMLLEGNRPIRIEIRWFPVFKHMWNSGPRSQWDPPEVNLQSHEHNRWAPRRGALRGDSAWIWGVAGWQGRGRKSAFSVSVISSGVASVGRTGVSFFPLGCACTRQQWLPFPCDCLCACRELVGIY